MQELHVREHDLRELKYLHAVKNNASHINAAVKPYQPFSGFYDQSGYCGFYPS